MRIKYKDYPFTMDIRFSKRPGSPRRVTVKPFNGTLKAHVRNNGKRVVLTSYHKTLKSRDDFYLLVKDTLTQMQQSNG